MDMSFSGKIKATFDVSEAKYEHHDDHQHIRKRGFKRRAQSEIEHWLRDFSDFSTIHGMKWYIAAPNIFFKVFFIIFIGSLFIALPVFFGFRTVDFFNSTSVSTSVDWNRATELPYPNLTVCFAKFFDKRLLDAENISANLANYMTMALDPNTKGHIEYMNQWDKTFPALIDTLALELDRILVDKYNGSLLTLFEKVAIKCDDFINLCEIHGRIKFTEPKANGSNNCCGDYFDRTPFFSEAGTCFTTKNQVMENMPFTYSSIKVWLSAQTNHSPEFDVMFKGSDSVERKGVYYTISDQDHPVTKLLQSPFKVTRGTAVLIGLSYRKIDQTSLSRKFCKVEDDEFLSAYNIPYTKLNCEVFANSQIHHNCSLSPYYGVLKNESSNRACEPKDFQDVNSFFHNDDTPCLPACLTTDYIPSVTQGSIDFGAIRRYFNLVGGEDFGTPDDMMVLQLYFQSFDYETLIISQELFIDFLSKIGGWLGLIMGASLLSFVELFFWVFLLLAKLCHHTVASPN